LSENKHLTNERRLTMSAINQISLLLLLSEISDDTSQRSTKTPSKYELEQEFVRLSNNFTTLASIKTEIEKLQSKYISQMQQLGAMSLALE
jgi:hypothetical protein